MFTSIHIQESGQNYICYLITSKCILHCRETPWSPTCNAWHSLENYFFEGFCWFLHPWSFPTSVFYDRWMNTSKSQAFSDWLTLAPLYPPLHPTSVLCFLFLVHHSLSTNSYKRPTKIWKRINEVKKVLSKAEVYHLWLGKLLYLCAIFKLQSKNKPDAQRQEMVIGTLALLRGLFIVAFEISRASGPKSCRTQGESVHLSIHPSIYPKRALAWASLRRVLGQGGMWGWMVGWIDVRPYIQIPPVFYRTSSIIWAEAQKENLCLIAYIKKIKNLSCFSQLWYCEIYVFRYKVIHFGSRW